MKLYVIINYSSRGLGGSYIYMMNKLVYAKSIGYDINFIHTGVNKEGYLIDFFKPYDHQYDERLQERVYHFPNFKRKSIVKEVISKFGLDKGYEEIIVESCSQDCATWGELIAKEIKAKHIVYLLGENESFASDIIYKFMDFKLKRHELFSITPKSIPAIFVSRRMLSEEEKNNCTLYARCSNSFSNVPYENLKKIPTADFIIGNLGRPAKPYFRHALIDERDYVLKHKDKTFTILIIGGDKNVDDFEGLYKIFDGINNAKVFITGRLFPIPLELMKIADVFIASSGCCEVCKNAGKMVISYDGNDFRPIGIWGITTKNSLFRGVDEPPLHLTDLLDDILVRKKYQNKEKVKLVDDIINFDDHFNAIKKFDYKQEYYRFGWKECTLNEICSQIVSSFFSYKVWKLVKMLRMKMIKDNIS